MKIGDVVFFNGNTCYPSSVSRNGKECLPGEAKVTYTHHFGTHLHRVHLKAVPEGESTVCGWVDAEEIGERKAETLSFAQYDVQLDEDTDIRKGPGNTFRKRETIEKNSICTIVEVKEGKGSESGWGRISTGEGWIPLDKTVKLEQLSIE